MANIDMVNKPPHYNKGKHPEGNIIKYIYRHKDKGANIQDLEKAEFYLKELIDYYKNL